LLKRIFGLNDAPLERRLVIVVGRPGPKKVDELVSAPPLKTIRELTLMGPKSMSTLKVSSPPPPSMTISSKAEI